MLNSGFLIINKEKGISSFDVIRKIKRNLGKGFKIGHMGTLDPMATGVLVLAINKATKLFDEFKKCNKEYLATAFFGAKSDTYDAEGKIEYCHLGLDKNLNVDSPSRICFSDIQKFLKSFTGKISQIPPAYSAVKVNGVRAYNLIRQGKKVELKPRLVEVFEFELLELRTKKIKDKGTFCLGDFRIICKGGTYVRSLINDLGEKLKTGAYVSKLKRIRVGDFSILKAHKLEDINRENVNDFIIPLS